MWEDVFLLIVLAVLVFRNHLALCFYRGYFRQKQVNLGKDPNVAIRKEFPHTWWLF